jgi:hypothetical protein
LAGRVRIQPGNAMLFTCLNAMIDGFGALDAKLAKICKRVTGRALTIDEVAALLDLL